MVEARETKADKRSAASRQAVTLVNTKTAPKGTMRRLTPPGLGESWNESVKRTTGPIHFAGVVGDGMSARRDAQHGKPQRWRRVTSNRQLVRDRSGRVGWRRGS